MERRQQLRARQEDNLTFALLVEMLGFPVWLVPRKIQRLDSLVVDTDEQADKDGVIYGV